MWTRLHEWVCDSIRQSRQITLAPLPGRGAAGTSDVDAVAAVLTSRCCSRAVARAAALVLGASAAICKEVYRTPPSCGAACIVGHALLEGCDGAEVTACRKSCCTAALEGPTPKATHDLIKNHAEGNRPTLMGVKEPSETYLLQDPANELPRRSPLPHGRCARVRQRLLQPHRRHYHS